MTGPNVFTLHTSHFQNIRNWNAVLTWPTSENVIQLQKSGFFSLLDSMYLKTTLLHFSKQSCLMTCLSCCILHQKGNANGTKTKNKTNDLNPNSWSSKYLLVIHNSSESIGETEKSSYSSSSWYSISSSASIQMVETLLTPAENRTKFNHLIFRLTAWPLPFLLSWKIFAYSHYLRDDCNHIFLPPALEYPPCIFFILVGPWSSISCVNFSCGMYEARTSKFNRCKCCIRSKQNWIIRMCFNIKTVKIGNLAKNNCSVYFRVRRDYYYAPSNMLMVYLNAFHSRLDFPKQYALHNFPRKYLLKNS